MQFTFRVSKLANKFFFISNLSEWHFSCRKDANQKWLEDTGPLLQKEKSALKEFEGIMKRYGFMYKNGIPTHLGKYFYLYPQHRSWDELKRDVSQTEYKKIRDVFSIFNQRFEKVWRVMGKKERERRITLLTSTLARAKNQKLIRVLASFFPKMTDLKNIWVVVLFPPFGKERSAAGSANIGNETFTLEIPALQSNTFELDISIGIFFHEVVHILFSRVYANEMIKKVMEELKLSRRPAKKSPVTTLELINEIATTSLVPYGYLTRKFYGKKFTAAIFSPENLRRMRNVYHEFRTKKKITNHHRLIKYFVWRLCPTVARHMRQGGQVDETFFRKIASVLKV